ncbi:cilia- and flagella-associated protein 157 isoform X1 [Gadus morhua]|uniref:Cilia- and flagella-associated protein 157 n=1 Tax=Gadus morhua TaxID=8049 RepID=A0A8C4Z7S0_GADMO|nr:cilia- and flagella-associated protein 157 isoform X1 [Gadus morhua]
MSKKNDRKDGERPQKKSNVSAAPTERSERDDGFYRLQVRALKGQVERYQQKCDEAELQKSDSLLRYSQLEQEMKDVVQYLKRSVAQLEEELMRCAARLESEQRTWEEQNRSLELRLSKLEEEHQEKSEKLSSENMMLAGKLASLEEFGEQKERLMSDLSSLEKQLANEKEAHNNQLYELHMEAALERARGKTKHADHMKQAALELQLQARRDVSEEVAQCLGEREALHEELAHLAEQNQALVRENQTLRDSETLTRRKDQLIHPLMRDLSHKNKSNLGVIRKLTDKCEELGVELKEQSSVCKGLQHIHTRHTLLLAEAQALRKEHELVLERGREDAITVKRLGAELDEEQRRRGQTEVILSEAAMALRQALTDERPGLEEQEEEVQAVVRRNQNMQKLLAVLDRAARLGANGRGTPELTSAPTAGQHQTHYRPGDLGLVPRQNQTSREFKVGPHPMTTSQHPRKTSQKRSGPSSPAR